jgi:hypothetical protein
MEPQGVREGQRNEIGHRLRMGMGRENERYLTRTGTFAFCSGTTFGEVYASPACERCAGPRLGAGSVERQLVR